MINLSCFIVGTTIFANCISYSIFKCALNNILVMGDANDTSEKNPRVTFNEFTSKWLDDNYPTAMTDPEKVRMAVNDAMKLHDLRSSMAEEAGRLLAGEADLAFEGGESDNNENAT